MNELLTRLTRHDAVRPAEMNLKMKPLLTLTNPSVRGTKVDACNTENSGSQYIFIGAVTDEDIVNVRFIYIVRHFQV